MKKILIIISIFLYALLGVFVVNKLDYTTPVSSTHEQYAKIIDSNCYFFKTPTKNYHYSNVNFILEKTYFVSIISEENDFYYVSYDNLKGYILKEQVELVNEIPSNPFLKNITFNTSNICFMYKAPEALESLKLTELTKDMKLTYIGKINGSREFLYGTNLWYYCKVVENNVELFGYVCSDNANNLSPINENIEITTTFSQTSNHDFLYLNATTSNFIILLISVPTFLVVFLLLKGFKN